MEKILTLALIVILGLLVVESVAAQSRTIVINPSPLYAVRVNGQTRELRTFEEKGNLHLLFFRSQEFLGEEIFDSDDIKFYDSYRENDLEGDWRDGYQKRYRTQWK